jgi:hypothetical protein
MIKKIFFYTILFIILYTVVFFLNFFSYRYYLNFDNKNNDAKKKYISYRSESLKKILLEDYKPITFPKYFHQEEIRNRFVKEYIPFNSVPYRNVFLCDEGYGMIKYKSDRFGFRNNDKNWDNLNQAFKIMIIGDSFAQGSCVEDEFYINDILNKKFNKKVNIYNLASSGNGPAINSSVISNFTEIIKPDIMLIILFSNDQKDKISNPFFTQSRKELDNYFVHRDGKPFLSEDISDTLMETEKYIIGLNKKNRSFSNFSFFEKLKKYLLLKHTTNKITELYNSIFFKLPNSTKFFIDLANNKCSKKCKLIFTYIPPSDYWSKEPLAKKYEREIVGYLKKSEIEYLDLSSIIDSSDILNYAPMGPHLSIEGYQKISMSIYKKINQFIKVN